MVFLNRFSSISSNSPINQAESLEIVKISRKNRSKSYGRNPELWLIYEIWLKYG